jgi:uncharacterized membrane protein YvlD (DUF360 family)
MMSYLKSLGVNFLTVYFTNHLMPGIDVPYYAKLPHIEGGLIFAAAVGAVNALVYPMMRLLKAPISIFKIALTCFIISFAAYSIVNLLPLEVRVTSVKGYFFSGIIVWIAAFITNFLAFKKGEPKKSPPPAN